MAVFWVAAPCSLVDFYRRFRGASCLHHQGGDRIASEDNLPILVENVILRGRPPIDVKGTEIYK
jgi:hypothetical protein